MRRVYNIFLITLVLLVVLNSTGRAAPTSNDIARLSALLPIHIHAGAGIAHVLPR